VYGGRYDEFAPFPRGPASRPPGAVKGGTQPPAAKSTTSVKPGQTPLPRAKPTEIAATPAPAPSPSAASQAAAAPAKAGEPPTGSVTPRRDAPSPAKPAAPEFPPVQPLE